MEAIHHSIRQRVLALVTQTVPQCMILIVTAVEHLASVHIDLSNVALTTVHGTNPNPVNSFTEPMSLMYYFDRMLAKFLLSTKIYVSGEFTVQTGHFCDPNTNMTSTTLEEAKLECLNDESCTMFYEDCAYPRFRKCSDDVYVEESQCGEQLGPSILYTKGKMKNYMP